MTAIDGITRSLSQWIASARFDDLPREAADRAKEYILDTFAVTVAGADSEPSQIVARHLARQPSSPVAVGIGRDIALGSDSAALLNGVSAHALDFDDQSYSLPGHPSAVVLPAVFAVAEEVGASGRDLLLAYVVGVETACKLGASLNPHHFQQGWHATASIGVFGAAAGCAVLWRLSADEVANALGLAAVRSGGLRANNGTMAKAYHVGQAAQAGVVSVSLTRAGLGASREVLEGSDGYIAAYNQGEFNPDPVRRLGAPFDVVSPGIMIKRYPACSGIAAALDALFGLLVGSGLCAEDIATIDCLLTPLAHRSMPYRIPRTPLEGKFSAPFLLAAAAVTGAVGVSTFSEQVLADSRVCDLMERVTTTSDRASGWAPADGPEGATVTLRTKDGREYRRQCRLAVGTPEIPLAAGDLHGKFRACVEGVLGATAAARLLDLLRELERVTAVKELSALLRDHQGAFSRGQSRPASGSQAR